MFRPIPIAVGVLLGLATNSRSELARGTVFDDRNGNGIRDAREPGLPGVRVSNQRDIVVTDAQGRWELPVSDDSVVFVVKPRGWMPPTDRHHLPRFFYVHKPAGSPRSLKHPGVDPTGPLPASIDFPLRPQKEPKAFKAVFMGDTQPRDIREVNYFRNSVVPKLVGTD
ncbi:MAG: hypothetical protein JNL97_12605, partial [Verrucomicrobiales bacterium]|nr:hypothetical protein [Verrucomicrobiales bacterium]